MQTLLWTTRRLRNLAKALRKKRHKASPTVVGNLLRELHYSLQANSKTHEGRQHIDRDAQFRYITPRPRNRSGGPMTRTGVTDRLKLAVATAAQRSQSLEAWRVHNPGVVVVAPATHAALLKAAIRKMEHKEL